jgi:hypothetical protein
VHKTKRMSKDQKARYKRALHASTRAAFNRAINDLELQEQGAYVLHHEHFLLPASADRELLGETTSNRAESMIGGVAERSDTRLRQCSPVRDRCRARASRPGPPGVRESRLGSS